MKTLAPHAALLEARFEVRPGGAGPALFNSCIWTQARKPVHLSMVWHNPHSRAKLWGARPLLEIANDP